LEVLELGREPQGGIAIVVIHLFEGAIEEFDRQSSQSHRLCAFLVESIDDAKGKDLSGSDADHSIFRNAEG
jgi:hypothetical protein